MSTHPDDPADETGTGAGPGTGRDAEAQGARGSGPDEAIWPVTSKAAELTADHPDGSPARAASGESPPGRDAGAGEEPGPDEYQPL